MKSLAPILALLASLTCATAQEPKTSASDALRDLTDRAATGNADAQLALALRYRDADGVARDLDAAMRWAHLAADQGHADARDFVGWMFFTGKGVKRDGTLAAAYFKSAANHSAGAAWNLGQCYFAAQGVNHDVPKALEMWKKAASLGHGRAASTAAMTYLSGEGIVPDPAKARRLAERAAELNDPNGLVLLGELHFQAGEFDQARAAWTKVSQMKPVGPTGNPEQPSAEMAAQQGADLLKLMDIRRRKPEPGKCVLVPVRHLHQGWNNCGATSCAMYARALGSNTGGWDFKKLCPSPLGTGTDWADLVKAAAKIGQGWKLVTFPADADGFAKATAFARAELDAGRPLVIDFKYVGDRYPGGAAGHTLLLAGYLAEENLYVLCNPAIASPGLHLITAANLDKYWRSDGYSSSSGGVLSRPAIVMDPGQPNSNSP